jgi:RNA polymerase sigma-70 factor (ECF subfamily)
MYTICHRMLGRDDDASDATQDAILKVISGLDSYDGRAKLSTWVIRITLNCCYDRMRADKRHKHAPLSAAVKEAEEKENLHSGARHREPSGLAIVQQHEARQSLLRALESLDAQSRTILVLRDVQDLDYQQVAEVLEVPVGTVKSRLYRARAALRAAIE